MGKIRGRNERREKRAKLKVESLIRKEAVKHMEVPRIIKKYEINYYEDYVLVTVREDEEVEGKE